jgi:serine/threonine protein kinase
MAVEDVLQSDVLGLTPALAVDDLGKYRLIAKLARGGMGVVHLALLRGPAGFNKLLVVKELRQEFAGNEMLVNSFMDEARLAARLNHPNIVQTIEVGTDGGRHFMAMEYLEGPSLHRLLHRAVKLGAPLPLDLQLGLQLDVLGALDYAHRLTDFGGAALGVVHRDVSPQNILVTYEGQIKLLDFGIAKSLDAPEETRSGVLKGKTRYMAPEQAAACGRVDRRADLFSVGIMLWEAIAGHRLWDGLQDADVLRSLLAGVIPSLRDVRPDVDPGLAAVVERAMSVDPEARYPTAQAMRDALEQYMVTRDLSLLRTRRLADVASSLFSADRQKLREVIDAQLRASDAEPGARPSVPNPQLAMAMPDSQGTPGSATPDAPPLTLPTLVLPSDGHPQIAPSPLHEPAHAPPAQRTWLLAAAGALGALVALAAFVVGRSSTHGFATAPSAITEVPTAPVESRPHAVHVIVRASPPAAQIYLDDQPIENPYVNERARDLQVHRLRIEAPGYATKTSTLTFSADVSVDIALAIAEPAVSRSRVAAPPAQPGAGGGPASSSSTAASDAAPKRIEMQNPYPIAPSGP